jgi:phosphohistidine swiveling domain-containing protein
VHLKTGPGGVGAVAASLWRGKGRTLERLAPSLELGRVPLGLCVSYAQWRAARADCVRRVQRALGAGAVAVRSSRDGEDAPGQSQAGRYRTLLDVPAADGAALAAAIDTVFASYRGAQPWDDVLLQAMVAPRVVAVASTHAIEDGAPYYVFSLGDGARTDTVTRGDAPVRTIYIARDAAAPADGDVARLYGALRELEALCGGAPVEAELALVGDETIVLQVRPLNVVLPDAQAPRTRRATLACERHALAAAPTRCVGERRVLALMPDWNTAELLGAHPRPLALDLFARLVGGTAWRRARAALGYRRIGRVDLVAPFAGRPYVDVRASANSLLPDGIDAHSAAALVDAWQTRLAAQPTLHDRYEFAIAQTCLDFDFDAQWQARYHGVLDGRRYAAYRDALREPTRRCLDADALRRALSRLARLDARGDTRDLARLVAAAEHDGALPFALLARQAFAAEALMRSALARGALAPERLDALKASCVGPTRELLDHGAAGDVRQRYGFLRAGTFEIATQRLAHLELAGASPAAAPAPSPPFVLAPHERRALDALAAEIGLALDADALVAHYREARQAREHGKYALSRAVSLVLERIAELGAQAGLDRDTLGWLTLGELELPTAVQRARADAARERHRIDALLRLPPVLDPAASLDIVAIDAGTPTFIGDGRVVARLVRVDASTSPAAVPHGAALAIESADPGFDWIFTRAPAALITAYGGPNSHMAIRCAELRVPAVLGLGVERWRRIAAADGVVVDTASLSLMPWKHNA